ncbi:MAG: hypothetical protein U5R06_22830 [candidate division KSB1 bacterium]|nr:hypothetical protein [candidate division KSB1 bacterium]
MNELNTLFSGLALVLSIISLYLHRRKPKLHIIYEDKFPFKKLLMVKNGSRPFPPEVFIRVKVLNSQRKIAKNCFGKITEWYTNGKNVNKFDPIKLHWVSNNIDDYSPIDLSKDEFEYLDILLTKKDQSKIQVYSNTHPRGTPLIFDDKDDHIFKLSIYCENETFVSKWFKVNFQEKDPDEECTWISMQNLDKAAIKKLKKDAQSSRRLRP